MHLMPSKLGLIPYGPYKISDQEGNISNNLFTVLKIGSSTNSDIILKEQLKSELNTNGEIDTELAFSKLFVLESMGVNDSEIDPSDQDILDFFRDNAKYLPEKQQYSVPLLFKNLPPDNLPSNKLIAMSRFNGLTKKKKAKKICQKI